MRLYTREETSQIGMSRIDHRTTGKGIGNREKRMSASKKDRPISLGIHEKRVLKIEKKKEKEEIARRRLDLPFRIISQHAVRLGEFLEGRPVPAWDVRMGFFR